MVVGSELAVLLDWPVARVVREVEQVMSYECQCDDCDEIRTLRTRIAELERIEKTARAICRRYPTVSLDPLRKVLEES